LFQSFSISQGERIIVSFLPDDCSLFYFAEYFLFKYIPKFVTVYEPASAYQMEFAGKPRCFYRLLAGDTEDGGNAGGSGSGDSGSTGGSGSGDSGNTSGSESGSETGSSEAAGN